MPRVLSPMPLLTMIPVFALGHWELRWLISPIPFGTFILMNSYLLRTSSAEPLPKRFPCLLGLATALSVLYFILGWKDGIRYQGASYTLASAVINAWFLLVLWTWWLAVRHRASMTAALGFATLLHSWLFWFAFPYLGELP
jgi:hypothetical protein